MITGSTGMLGNRIIRAFLIDSRYSLIGVGRSLTALLPKQDQIQVDFSMPSGLISLEVKADVIIHTAAMTDLKLCEADSKLAYKVNVESTGELAKKIKPGGAFFYISTDSVFDGLKGNYQESDTPNPLNTYARTKLAGEQISRVVFPDSTIIRTNIYGFHEGMKNSLAEWAFQAWQKEQEIAGYTDVVFNAVYTGYLADVIKSMIDNQIHYPVLNVASREILSKYDFLNLFREKLGIDKGLLVATTSDHFPSLIKRPLNTSLDVSLLKSFKSVPTMIDGLDAWIRDVRNAQIHKINN